MAPTTPKTPKTPKALGVKTPAKVSKTKAKSASESGSPATPRTPRGPMSLTTKAYIAGAILSGQVTQSQMVAETGYSASSVCLMLQNVKKNVETLGINYWDAAAYEGGSSKGSAGGRKKATAQESPLSQVKKATAAMGVTDHESDDEEPMSGVKNDESGPKDEVDDDGEEEVDEGGDEDAMDIKPEVGDEDVDVDAI